MCEVRRGKKQEIFISSAQFYCEPETSLKNRVTSIGAECDILKNQTNIILKTKT